MKKIGFIIISLFLFSSTSCKDIKDAAKNQLKGEAGKTAKKKLSDKVKGMIK
ncbi:MAG: hypothetical protein GY754_26130 [bacterium]|nr:hypothetical protein [bacterium]